MNDLKYWLKSHNCISVRCLENEAGIPNTTLSHFIAGRRGLTQGHLDKLLPVLNRYGYLSVKTYKIQSTTRANFENTSNCELAAKGMERCENNCGAKVCRVY